METTLKLMMTFLTDFNTKVTLNIDDPSGSIQETDIKDVMELIITKGIFEPNGYKLVSCEGAKVVQTETTEFDLV